MLRFCIRDVQFVTVTVSNLWSDVLFLYPMLSPCAPSIWFFMDDDIESCWCQSCSVVIKFPSNIVWSNILGFHLGVMSIFNVTCACSSSLPYNSIGNIFSVPLMPATEYFFQFIVAIFLHSSYACLGVKIDNPPCCLCNFF